MTHPEHLGSADITSAGNGSPPRVKGALPAPILLIGHRIRTCCGTLGVNDDRFLAGPSRARRRRILIESAWGAAGAGVSSSLGGIWAVSAGPRVD